MKIKFSKIMPDIPNNSYRKPAAQITSKILLEFLIVGLIYYLGALISFRADASVNNIPIIWPSNALVLAFLLLSNKKKWPIYLLGVIPAVIIAEVQAGYPVSISVSNSLINIFEIFFAASIIARIANPSQLFSSTKNYAVYIVFGVLVPPLFSAVLRAGVTELFGNPGINTQIDQVLYFRSVIAYQTLTPVILLIGVQRNELLKDLRIGKMIEGSLILIGTVAVGFVMLKLNLQMNHGLGWGVYVLIMLCFLASIRFGPLLAHSSVFSVSIIAVMYISKTIVPADRLILSIEMLVYVMAVSTGILSVLLSEKNNTEAKLRASEITYRDLFENANDAILFLNKNLKFTDVNRKAVEIWGFAKNEFLMMSLDDLINHENGSAANRFLEKLRAAGEYGKFAAESVTKNGANLIVEFSSSAIIKNGELAGTRSIVRDITDRQKAEEELYESKQRYKNLFDHMLNAFSYHKIIYDENGKPSDYVFLEANDAFSEMTGLSKNNIVGKKVTEVIPGIRNDSVDWIGIYGEVARAGKRIFFENKSDALNKYYNITAFSPKKDYFGVIFEDITKRKLAELELSESEKTLRALLNANRDAAFLIDKDGKIFAANESLAEYTGKTQQQILGRNLQEVLSANIYTVLKPKIDEVLESGSPIRFEDRRDDRWFSNIIYPVFDSTGRIIKLAVFGTDITEQKLASEALEQAEERFRLLIEKASDIITIINAEGKIKYQSPAVRTILGYNQHELVGLNVFEFVHPEDFQKVVGVFKNGLSTNLTSAAVEFRFRHKNGNWVYLESIGRNLLDHSAVNGIIINTRDISDRRKAEAEVISEKIFSETVINSLPGIFYMYNEEGKLVRWNKNHEILLGYSHEELSGITASRIFAEEDRFRIAKKLRELQEYGEASVEARIIDRDGKKKPYLLTGSVIEINNKKYLAGTGVDITDRKIIEEALSKSEAINRRLVESAPVGILYLDEDMRVTYLNPVFLKLTGVNGKKKSPALGIRITDLDTVKRAGAVGIFERIYNGEAVFDSEVHYVSILGVESDLEIHGTPLLGKNGKVEGAVVMVMDITQRKLAEDEIRRREAFFNAIVENIPTMVFIKDAKSLKFVKVNKAGEELLGFSEEEMLGKTDFDIFDQDEAEFFVSVDMEVLNTGRMKDVQEEKITTRLGKKILRTMKIPLLDDEGQPEYLLGISLDMTEKLQYIEQLKKAKEAAETASRLRSEFLAQMSHEIRTPINTILSFSSLIREEVEDTITPDLKYGFKGMASAGQRIIRTIDLILNMAEIQTGSFEYDPENIELCKEVLENLFYEYQPKAQERGIDLSIQANSEDSVIYADRYSVNQIFANLIDNALKYTTSGNIEVICSNTSDSGLRIDIKDTGIGISGEYLENLFEPFTQEDHGYTRKFEGNGLGLALVKKYCEMNDASIYVSSEKGKGSTFTVVFKQRKPESVNLNKTV